MLGGRKGRREMGRRWGREEVGCTGDEGVGWEEVGYRREEVGSMGEEKGGGVGGSGMQGGGGGIHG